MTTARNFVKRIIVEELKKLISEGGWTSLKTQQTKLSPLIIKSADAFTKNLLNDFNGWLKRNHKGIPGLNPVRPVGSGIYYEKDIEEDPEKIYGDVDYLIEYPVLRNTDSTKKDEADSVRFYNQELFKFFDETKPKGVVIEDSKGRDGGTGVVIAEVEPDKYVQIDFVATHKEYTDWAMSRFTPIRNVKGFVSGAVYASLAEALLLSIGDKGARVKLRNGIIIPYNQKKDAEEKIITTNFKSFLRDIAKFFIALKRGREIGNIKNSSSEDVMELDSSNLSLEKMINAIKSLGQALDKNGVFDGETTSYTNSRDFYSAVANSYEAKMNKVLNNPKFKKAQNADAEKARDKIFKFATDSKNLVNSMLR